MKPIETSLAEARREIDDMVRTATDCANCWSTPRAPGKWSPSQVMEHVSRSFEASASDVLGARSGFPSIPRLLHPVLRTVLFNKVLKSGRFQKARTNKAMNPDKGAESPAAGIERLELTWTAFTSACDKAAANGGVAKSRLFGVVSLADYIRFQGYHAKHHRAQMKGPGD